MNSAHRKIRLAPVHYQDKLAAHRNRKLRLQALLMLDCGLRVSEVVRLQVKHFDFYRKEVTVESLKKRTRPEFRTIPMTDRVFAALADYWEKIKQKKNPDAYLFPAGHGGKQPHMNRKQVWKRVKKHTDKVVSPHDLRHTFATRIVNEGNGIRIAQSLLGHASQATTEVYLHVEEAEKRKAIASLQRHSLPAKLYKRLFPPQQPNLHVLPMDKGLTQFHIGRKEELAKLAINGQHKINTLVLGPQGIGKSHLLDNYTEGRIIRVGDFGSVKKVLAGMLLEIVDRNPERRHMLETAHDKTEIIKRKAIKFLIEDLVALTTRGEYTIIVDDVTRITPTAVSALEKLKNHYHLICAARNVEVKKGTFLTNFERIELRPLPRTEAVELCVRLSRPFLDKIEDLEAYKNHIWENTQGNPLFICEMVERYGKEQRVSLEVVSEVRHTAALQEINFLPFFIGLLACMSVLRYWGRISGTDAGPFYFLAGIGVIFLFFGRQMIRATKRKYV
ncbi:MAG: tyrosine-type recombinase/integrase [Saprospiraceae bacterium]